MSTPNPSARVAVCRECRHGFSYPAEIPQPALCSQCEEERSELMALPPVPAESDDVECATA